MSYVGGRTWCLFLHGRNRETHPACCEVIRPAFVLVAESILQDMATNQVSVINLIEEVRPVGYPLLVPRLAVLVIFERDEDDDPTGEANLRILIEDQELFTSTLDFHFGESRLFRSILQFHGFSVPDAGSIRVRVDVGEASAESFPIPAFPAGAPVADAD